MSERLPDQLTPATPAEMYASLERAWKLSIGSTASRDSLLVLLGQWALETGRGKSMHCFNVGNAKHVDNDGRDFCFFACDEVIGGRIVWFYPVDPACCFRAFRTLDEGVADYLDLIRRRFAASWPAVLSGSPSLFAHMLKTQGYYTADEAQYAHTLVALFQEFDMTLGLGFDLHTVAGQQAALNKLGMAPPLTVDGEPGPHTQAAVRTFQRAHGLTVDGICGPRTVAELGHALAALPPDTDPTPEAA
jgi:hypothetical protein